MESYFCLGISSTDRSGGALVMTAPSVAGYGLTTASQVSPANFIRQRATSATVHAVGDVSFGAVGLEAVPGEVVLLVLEPLYSVGRCTRSLESVRNTKQRDHETVSAEWNASAIRAASARRPGTRNLTSIKP